MAQQATDVDGVDVTANRTNPLQELIRGIMPPGDPQMAPSLNAGVDPGQSPMVGQDPQSPTVNYNNGESARAVHAGLASEPNPQASSAGIFGLLPDHVQHGTLRNVLGALGDAFLVGSGRDRQYQPRMERQQMGNSIAGLDINDPASVQAAVQRLAATGAPGAMEMATKIQEQAEQAALRKQQMEYTAAYRTSTINDRNQTIFARLGPSAQGMVSAAKDANDYAARYAVLDRRAKAVDPQADAASAFGIPLPEDWSKTVGWGMTSNQQQQSSDRAAGRATTERGQDIGYRGRVDAAGINAGGHVAAAGISAAKPTEGTILQDIRTRANSGQPLAAGDQAIFDHATHVTGGRGGRGLPPAVHPNAAPANPASGYSHIATDGKGHKKGWNGHAWVDIH